MWDRIGLELLDYNESLASARTENEVIALSFKPLETICGSDFLAYYKEMNGKYVLATTVF